MNKPRVWQLLLLAGGAIVVLVISLVVQGVSARQTGSGVEMAVADCTAGSKTLVVAVHGMGGDVDRLSNVLALAREQLPNADLLVPHYRVGWLSNSDPLKLAGALQDAINAHYRDCARSRGQAYDRVILIGYSAGGLLLRRVRVGP